MVDISRFTESRDWPFVEKLAQLLEKWNIHAYIVGGWIRDRLSDRDTDDIDLVVMADGLVIAEKLALIMGGKYVQLDEVNGIGRVVFTGVNISSNKQRTIDIATCKDTIEKDLSRRDFTVNAMAIDISKTGKSMAIGLIDPFHGQEDLKDKKIRAVLKTAFSSDPVRLLRAVRLAVMLDFTVETETESMIKRDALLITKVSNERVREEMLLLLSNPGSGSCLEYLDKQHLLTEIFPEIELSRDFPQPPEHHWDVLSHSLKTVGALDYLLRQGEWQYAGEDVLNEVPWSDELRGYFEGQIGHESNRAALTRLAALLHDIAKPKMRIVEPGGKIRFLGHAGEGATMSTEICERLRFSNKEKRFVETLVKNHLRPTQMGLPELPTNRALYRYYRDTGDAAIGTLFLSLADHLATRGPSLDSVNWKVHTHTVKYALTRQPEVQTKPVRLIDGYDIMNIFSLGPGPLVGELLELVQEAQAAGEVTTKDEALELVKQRFRAQFNAHKGRNVK